MKSIDGPTVRKLIKLILLFIFTIYVGYTFYYNYTYKSIGVELKKNTFVEYNSKNFNIKKFIKKVDGKIISVNNELDTSLLGAQELILKVKKGIVVRNVPVIISVVDVTAPVINLKTDVVRITQGQVFNLNDNVASVVDEIDGSIQYLNDSSTENNLNKYSVYASSDVNSVGVHAIAVEAVDSYGNVARANYTLEVQEITPYQRATRIHYNLAPNAHSDALVATAYSLLGKPYGRANGPDVFDCSGLVQYVYASVGINVSRSSDTQLYDGLAVSRNDMMPGDIICWGYGDGVVSHTAIYVGNGQMIHAANYNQGVILSNVDGWDRGSSQDVISIRRI